MDPKYLREMIIFAKMEHDEITSGFNNEDYGNCLGRIFDRTHGVPEDVITEELEKINNHFDSDNPRGYNLFSSGRDLNHSLIDAYFITVNRFGIITLQINAKSKNHPFYISHTDPICIRFYPLDPDGNPLMDSGAGETYDMEIDLFIPELHIPRIEIENTGNKAENFKKSFYERYHHPLIDGEKDQIYIRFIPRKFLA